MAGLLDRVEKTRKHYGKLISSPEERSLKSLAGDSTRLKDEVRSFLDAVRAA